MGGPDRHLAAPSLQAAGLQVRDGPGIWLCGLGKHRPVLRPSLGKLAQSLGTVRPELLGTTRVLRVPELLPKNLSETGNSGSGQAAVPPSLQRARAWTQWLCPTLASMMVVTRPGTFLAQRSPPSALPHSRGAVANGGNLIQLLPCDGPCELLSDAGVVALCRLDIEEGEGRCARGSLVRSEM